MKSLKIRLELNNQQRTLASKHAGSARYAYNWALDRNKKRLEQKEKLLSSVDLHKLWVSEVKSVHAWTYEVSKCSPQQAFRDLETGFKRCFIQKIGKFPVFKKKGQRDSFYLEGAIKAKGNSIKLPKFGWVKCSETLPDVAIKNVVISRQADHWFVSFKVPHTTAITEKQTEVVGVDLGIKTLATLSDGKQFTNPRPYKNYQRKLRLAQRQMSKKWVKGKKIQSKNYQKAKGKVAKLHYKVANIRKDHLHKLTTYLSKNHAEIVIEDLNVKGMSQNHRLASAILDGGFYEFKRQLTYKCAWYGAVLTLAPRYFASSKTCAVCGQKKAQLSLKDRIFRCDSCGHEQDRDLNAAINLKKQAVSYTASACGALDHQKPAGLGTL